ncbi:MAG: MarR family transcriptional regulator [Actinomycetota bacterium]|nr:MarR family transcriptional regulator [Actinomycetota bacterium]
MEDEIDRIVQQWNRVRPELDVSPTHVLQRITRLGLLQGTSFGRVFARHGLSWGEYLVLAALRRTGPPYQMSPTTLYGAVILSSGGMTKRLDRLEDAGLVERLPDPDDRRGRLVALTSNGLELVDRAVSDHLANEQHLLSVLSTSERRVLSDLLRKLLTSEPFRKIDPAGQGGAPS